MRRYTIKGKLWYHGGEDRYRIVDAEGNTLRVGLHCGELLEVETPEGWVPTRIEYNDNKGWYLVGTAYQDHVYVGDDMLTLQLSGLHVRM